MVWILEHLLLRTEANLGRETSSNLFGKQLDSRSINLEKLGVGFWWVCGNCKE
jgi:hypothetical protein